MFLIVVHSAGGYFADMYDELAEGFRDLPEQQLNSSVLNKSPEEEFALRSGLSSVLLGTARNTSKVRSSANALL